MGISWIFQGTSAFGIFQRVCLNWICYKQTVAREIRYFWIYWKWSHLNKSRLTPEANSQNSKRKSGCSLFHIVILLYFVIFHYCWQFLDRFFFQKQLWKDFAVDSVALLYISLIHIRPMLHPYRNQLIDLRCKSIDWFLHKFNIGLI